MSTQLSFFDVNFLRRTQEFIGIGNYQEAITDEQLINSVKVTVQFLISKVPIQVGLALGLALLINRKIFAIGFFRSLPLMATVMPMSITAIIWRMMYHPTNGLINSVIRSIGLAPIRFLGDPSFALPSVVATTVWKDVGFYMIIFLAGLQGIPEEYYEAAIVDGANAFDKFRYITLPLLRRTTTIVLILSTITSFQVFIPAKVMTEGGPLSTTNVILYYIWKKAFIFNRMGYAQTLAILTLIVVSILAIVQNRISGTDEE
jgi:ABC-type sugar transport system permease subunit